MASTEKMTAMMKEFHAMCEMKLIPESICCK